jgi:PadR family transcriptional regulator PadR
LYLSIDIYGRIMPERETLGRFEMAIVGAIMEHPQDAYGLAIRDRIEARSGKAPSIGSLYTALERLERRGYLSSEWGEATAVRGGRRKRLYKVEASGVRALRATVEDVHRALPLGWAPEGAR